MSESIKRSEKVAWEAALFSFQTIAKKKKSNRATDRGLQVCVLCKKQDVMSSFYERRMKTLRQRKKLLVR